MFNLVVRFKMLWFLGAFSGLLKVTIIFIISCLFLHPSVRPRGTTRLQLNGFSYNFVFYFSKIRQENSSSIKIRQEQRVLYIKTNVQYIYVTIPPISS